MTYGYIQYNNDGYVQIDDTYSNLKEVSSGTLYTGYETYFPGTSSIPLIAFKNTYSVNQFMYLYRVSTSSFIIQAENSAQYPVDYKVYSTTDTPSPAGGYGMRIFNPSGVCLFDSNYGYMGIKYISDITSTLAPVNGVSDFNVTSVTHNVGSNGYVFLNGLQGYSSRYYFGEYDSQIEYGLTRIAINTADSNTAYFKRFISDQEYSTSTQPDLTTSQFNLIIGS
jgi:hypothetical protein